MTDSVPIVLAAVPVALLLIGIVLTIIGLRGRKIDDHPLCRRCGYDLSGLTDSPRCPECGSEISPDRVKTGHRRRRRRPLIAGLLLAVPSLLVLLAVGVLVARGTDWEKYKPFWMLLREGDTRAIVELNRRATVTRSLSKSQEQRLIAAALTAQADMKQPWLTAWGDLIEAMRAAGKLPDKDWQRYARQGVSISLQVRPTFRRGDFIAIESVHNAYRLSSRMRLFASARLDNARIDGVDIDRPPPDPIWGDLSIDLDPRAVPGPLNNIMLPISAHAQHSLSNGPHAFRTNLSISVHDGLLMQVPSQNAPPMVTWSVPLSFPIMLVPATQPTVELVHDPQLRPLVESSLSVTGPNPGDPRSSIRVDRWGVRAEAGANRPPIGLAFDAFLRDPAGRIWKLDQFGSICYPANAPPVVGGWNAVGPVEGFDSDTADLILRPNIAAARNTTYLTRIWGEDVVFHDVKVIWSPGTPRPWTSHPAQPAASAPSRRVPTK